MSCLEIKDAFQNVPESPFSNYWSRTQEDRGEKGDFLYKVRGIYDHPVWKFKELYNFSQEITIDEAFVPFKFKEKFTLKVRMACSSFSCDAENGYCKNFIMYVTDRVVMKLVEDLHH